MESVNNESSEIIRMLNSAFDEVLANDPKYHPELDFYPQALRGEIDEINSWIYDTGKFNFVLTNLQLLDSK